MTIHIDYPYHFDERGRTALTIYDDHVRDMIEQLLFTSPGERLNRPDFGCGLLRLVFDPNSPELAAVLQFNIRGSLERWLGDVIQVDVLEVTAEDSKLQVHLQYTLLRTNEQRDTVFERNAP